MINRLLGLADPPFALCSEPHTNVVDDLIPVTIDLFTFWVTHLSWQPTVYVERSIQYEFWPWDVQWIGVAEGLVQMHLFVSSFTHFQENHLYQLVYSADYIHPPLLPAPQCSHNLPPWHSAHMKCWISLVIITYLFALCFYRLFCNVHIYTL